MAVIDRVREIGLNFIHCRDDPFSSFVLDRPVDRTAGEGIGDGQCECVLSLGTVAAVSDRIDRDHAWLPINGRDAGT